MVFSARAKAATSPTKPAPTPILVTCASALLLAGCMSGGNTLRPLPPVPTTTVTANSLPQPITFGQEPAIESQTLDDVAGTDPNAPFDPNAPLDGSVDAAGLASAPLPEPPGGAAEVSEDDLIGAWSAATPMATCSINLSLTTWQGGYRASTRNCGDVQLSGLTAWSIEGQQVLLRDTEGAPIGRLFRTGPTRYAGQLDTGGALTLFR
jgi:hypothetical protein